jgi:hypothetical protein
MDESQWDLSWEEVLELIEREPSQAGSGSGFEPESTDTSGEDGGPVDV